MWFSENEAARNLAVSNVSQGGEEGKTPDSVHTIGNDSIECNRKRVELIRHIVMVVICSDIT